MRKHFVTMKIQNQLKNLTISGWCFRHNDALKNISEPANVNSDGQVLPSDRPLALSWKCVSGEGGGGVRGGGEVWSPFLPLQPSHTLCWVFFLLYLSTHRPPPTPSAVNPDPVQATPPRQPHPSDSKKKNPLRPRRDQNDGPSQDSIWASSGLSMTEELYG